MSGPHTLGPWKACHNGDCSCGQVWSLPADMPVATANTIWGDDLEHPYGEIPVEQMHANARLIAAAPQLLEAAQDTVKALNLLRLGLIERAPETIEMIDAHIDELWTAITKAAGAS